MAGERRKPWFGVKRLGYGVGRPVAWEGWLMLASYVATLVLSALLLPPFGFTIVLLLGTLAFLFVARQRSDDAWRWRGGE